MKEILIINLKRNGDIFTTGNIIRSYKAKYNDCKISLLVFEEFKKAAQALLGVENVHTIDRKKILTFKKNKIFSDGFAVDQFAKDLSHINNKNWDIVFNYSNDRVSTHITSFLKSKMTKHVGIRFNDTCNVEYSNEWAIVFNDIIPSVKYSPITFTDTYMNMASLTEAPESYILKTKTEYNESAAKNFSDIRKIENNGNDIKLVGIQLFSSSKTKSLSSRQLVEIIDTLYMNPNYFPILLVAPNDQERTFADEINNDFNNSLVSVEADFVALNSVLMHLDLLITTDTAIKHIADLSNLPTIEISLGEAPIFKQGTLNCDSMIITPRVDTRVFSKKIIENDPQLQSANRLIEAQDILAIADHLMFAKDISSYDFNKGLTIYEVKKDTLGSVLLPKFGDYSMVAEIERLASRQYLAMKLLNTDSEQILPQLKNINVKSLDTWLNLSKDNITETSKVLLGTLRSLLQLDGTVSRNRSFVEGLANLLNFCESESQFSAVPLLRFRARIEALNTSDFLQSSREVEALLYELKADMQIQVEVLKTLTTYSRQTKDQQRNRVSIGASNAQ